MDEYHRLLAATADSGLGFNPDTGHIVHGGQDLMSCLERHAERIRHVHIKDVDEQGRWQALGQGIIAWSQVFTFLEQIDYDGWVICEEESAYAFEDPNGAVKANRDFLTRLGY